MKQSCADIHNLFLFLYAFYGPEQYTYVVCRRYIIYMHTFISITRIIPITRIDDKRVQLTV